MKILISDYTTPNTTEPLYLNTVLNSIDCISTIWPHNLSTFDAFDIINPDIHITHHLKLTRDLILYLQENKNIDLIINITGITQENLTNLGNVLKDVGIRPALMYVNYYDHNLTLKNTNITTILHGADVFLGYEPKQYDIDYAIFVDNKSQLSPIGESYHYVTTDEKLEKEADIFLPIVRLNHLYHNYQNVVIKYFQNEIPQLFFDAALKVNTFFDIEDRTKLDNHLNKLLGDGKHCSLQDPNSGDIKTKIMQKHTCLHRTKSLLSQLPCKEYTDKLQEIIESSTK